MPISNRVTLIGFTGKDAEVAPTQAGKQLVRLAVATNKRYKDQNDQWQEKTTWHRCVAHGKVAEYAGKLTKGTHILIEGELTYRESDRTIETAEGPVKVQWPVTEILVDSIQALSRHEKHYARGAA